MASREAEEEVGSPDAAPLVVARRWLGARSQHARFEQPYNLFDIVRRERDQGLRRVRHLRGHIVLLWDGGGVHRGPALDRLLERHARLHIERFPAYAPELNPDDRNGTTVTNLGRSHARGDGRGPPRPRGLRKGLVARTGSNRHLSPTRHSTLGVLHLRHRNLSTERAHGKDSRPDADDPARKVRAIGGSIQWQARLRFVGSSSRFPPKI
jgi:hypothetical protein